MSDTILQEIADNIGNGIDLDNLTVNMSEDDYNNIAWIGNSLHEINDSLKTIVKLMEAGQ